MTDKLKFTVLGCGSSTGVPRINGNWGDCDPKEPKNRRLRSSLLVERISARGKTTVVVDTGPDFHQQMVNANVSDIDAVVYTHAHADHVHGIDDLRSYALAKRARVTIYADHATQQRLDEGFGYCFKQPEGSSYPPILNAYELEAFKPVIITGEGGDIYALPVLQVHGLIHSLGFRFSVDGNFETGGLCYSSDVSEIPDDTVPYLENLDAWILDALQYAPHTNHFSVSESCEWIERMKPNRAILTHMHIPLDYNVLKSELPENIQPAYDGMVIEL